MPEELSVAIFEGIGARKGVIDPEDREAGRKQSSVDDVAEIAATRGPSGTSSASPQTLMGPLDPKKDQEAMQLFQTGGRAAVGRRAHGKRDQRRLIASLAVLVSLVMLGLGDRVALVEVKGSANLEISARVTGYGPVFGSFEGIGARKGVIDPEDREAGRKQSSVDDVAEIAATRGPSGTSPILSAGVLSRIA